ncbi:hypothetical protein C8R44DRAFT_753274 [Mycena epipterygia]|nr:hypothetical protein C8R44DRAFT_753274 [Mycena epipterygia]
MVIVSSSDEVPIIFGGIAFALAKQGINIIPTLIVVRAGLGHNIQDTITNQTEKPTGRRLPIPRQQIPALEAEEPASHPASNTVTEPSRMSPIDPNRPIPACHRTGGQKLQICVFTVATTMKKHSESWDPTGVTSIFYISLQGGASPTINLPVKVDAGLQYMATCGFGWRFARKSKPRTKLIERYNSVFELTTTDQFRRGVVVARASQRVMRDFPQELIDHVIDEWKIADPQGMKPCGLGCTGAETISFSKFTFKCADPSKILDYLLALLPESCHIISAHVSGLGEGTADWTAIDAALAEPRLLTLNGLLRQECSSCQNEDLDVAGQCARDSGMSCRTRTSDRLSETSFVQDSLSFNT